MTSRLCVTAGDSFPLCVAPTPHPERDGHVFLFSLPQSPAGSPEKADPPGWKGYSSSRLPLLAADPGGPGQSGVLGGLAPLHTCRALGVRGTRVSPQCVAEAGALFPGSQAGLVAPAATPHTLPEEPGQLPPGAPAGAGRLRFQPSPALRSICGFRQISHTGASASWVPTEGCQPPSSDADADGLRTGRIRVYSGSGRGTRACSPWADCLCGLSLHRTVLASVSPQVAATSWVVMG